MLVEFLQLITNNIFIVPEAPPALCEIIIAPKGLSLGFEYFIVTTFYLLHWGAAFRRTIGAMWSIL